jgi:predicted dienelactone hydrolase
MPWIEVALVIVALAAAALSFRNRSRTVRYLFTALAAFALIWQLEAVGLHWQIFPGYCGLSIAIFLLWIAVPRISRVLLASATAALGLITVAALWALPIFSLPLPTGPYAVGSSGPLHWTDEARTLSGAVAGTGSRRELELQIWYPATSARYGERTRYARAAELSFGRSYEAVIRINAALGAPIADKGGPFPVLLFGHRWGGTRTQDTFLAEDLASHGYVVVAIDHPLNAARVEMSDGSVLRSDRADALSNLEASSAAAIEALWANELAIWIADDEFVLDTLKKNNHGWFAGRLDFNRVGAFGHSFGGAVSTALLGVDPRVKCAVNLDGWTFQGLDHRTTQPILEVYEGGSEPLHPETGVEGALDDFDNAAVDGSLARYGGFRAYVAATQHLDFTDQTLLSPLQRLTYTGPIEGARIRAITRGLVLGFFDQTLKGTGEIPAYPEVHLQRFPAPG